MVKCMYIYVELLIKHSLYPEVIMANDEVLGRLDNIEKHLRALVILQIEALKLGDPQSKPEILLAASDLTHKEIAVLVGKSKGAVSKAISRAS